MSDVLSDHSREQNIVALQQVFKDDPAVAVYLRGSYLREEMPYDDLDIVEISQQPHAEFAPASFRGAKIAYVHLTLNEWETYLRECPRSWYMYYDAAPLHQHEDKADEIFIRERTEYFASKEPDHLAYLRYETEMVNLRAQGEPTADQDYESLKNIPGSKRSVMRAIFMLKALHPHLREMTTPELLGQSAEEGIIPASMPDTANRIYKTLANQPINIGELRPLTHECMAWMGQLLVEVDQTLAATLPESYLSLLDTTVNSESSVELRAAQQTATQLNEPQRRWTASYLLANNANAPSAALESIASEYGEGYSGRLIRDALRKRGL